MATTCALRGLPIRLVSSYLKTSQPKSVFQAKFHRASALSGVSPIGLGSSTLLFKDSIKTSLNSKRNASGSVLGATSSVDVEQLKGAKEALKELILSKYCSPILIRLGWHDSGTYDQSISEWPLHGGADGSLRFKPEIDHGANAGLVNALNLLEPIKEKYPNVSYADLFQMASAVAVEVAGGPKIPMRYGRLDVSSPEQCSKEGNLPDAAPPSPAEHLRKVFYRMGLNDEEIVALSGAHTLGRAKKDRSGFGKEETKYTKDGPGSPGGSSWTKNWLQFDNSYYQEIKAKTDAELLVLPTDAVLFEDPQFKVYAEKYAADEGAFFEDYAKAHKKLSELGSKFDPPAGVVIDEPIPQPKKFVASEFTSGKSEYSAEMKEKMRKEYLSIGGSPDNPLPSNTFLNIIIGISVLVVLSKLFGAF